MDILDLVLIICGFVLIAQGVKSFQKNGKDLILTLEANKEQFLFMGVNREYLKVGEIISLIIKSKKNLLLAQEKDIVEKNYYVIKRSLLILCDIAQLDRRYVLKYLQALSKEIEVRLMALEVKNYTYLIDKEESS